MNKKMLLFGGTGLLGSRIIKILTEYTIFAPTRLQIDLTQRNDIEKLLTRESYDVIVYAAGISNQDFAQENQKLTMTINKSVVAWIAAIAAAKKTPLIYFSSDAVFPGRQSTRPYAETDHISPVNFYGRTKLAGEEAVLGASKSNLVLRLISLYSGFPHKKMDFARLILSKLTEGKICYGITDQYFNPCFVDSIVECLKVCIDNNISHVIHLGATDYMTNYEFTKLLATKFSFDEALIKRISFNDFFIQKRAKRGKFVWLDTTLAQRLFGKGVLTSNRENIESFYKQVIAQKTIVV